MEHAADQKLDSWKEIASYLSSSVRSVQRWEKTEGLPIRRAEDEDLGTVYAVAREIDEWLEARDQTDETGIEADSAPSGSVTGESLGETIRALRERIAAATAPTSDTPAATAPDAVGRSVEKTALLAEFDAAAQGQIRVTCVAGEAGIGKTTLVDSFLADLARAGRPFALARGHCSERLAGSEAYLAVLDALDRLLQEPGGDAIGELLRLVAPTWYVQVAPLWESADPAFARIVDEGKTASRERMKRELAAFLEELSRIRPTIFALDDLHWADPSTVELIAYLAKRPRRSGLMILVAYRVSEILAGSHPFIEVRHELQSRGLCKEVEVSFLRPQEVQNHLDQRYPGHDFPPEFASFIHRRTEGSPLFMVDLVGALEHQGQIVDRGQGFRLEANLADVERELPESIRSLIHRKIEQLDEPDRQLLSVASVQGSEFDSSIVAEVCDIPADDVERRLERLGRIHGLVRLIDQKEFPGGRISLRYKFVHVLYQNQLHASLSPTRSATLARDVAECLLTLHGDKHGHIAAELAMLFREARDHVRAADFFLASAQNAAGLFANDEGVILYQRAIEEASELPDEERIPRTLKAAIELALLKKNLARFDEAEAAYRVVEKAAEEANDRDTQIEAICGIANCLFLAKKVKESEDEAERALFLARSIDSRTGIAKAEAVFARAHLCRGDFEKAEKGYERSVPLLRERGGPEALDAVGFRILLHAWRLEHGDVERGSRWWLEQAREVGAVATPMLFFVAMSRGNAGRLSEAADMVEEGIRLAELHDDGYHACRLPNVLAWLQSEMGDEERAYSLDVESVQLARELDFEEAEANALVNLGGNHLALGEPDRGLEFLGEAERLFERDTWFRWRYAIRLKLTRSRAYLAKGDLREARAHADDALRAATESTARKHMAGAHHVLGQIDYLEDKVDQADQSFATALSMIQRNACPALAWRILASRAALAQARGQSRRADDLGRESQALIHRLGDSITDDDERKRFLDSRLIRATPALP